MVSDPCLSLVCLWVHLLPQVSGLGRPASKGESWTMGLPQGLPPRLLNLTQARLPSLPLVLLKKPTLLLKARGSLPHGPGSWAAMPSQVQAALGHRQEPWL